MPVVENNVAWNANMYIKEFIEEIRVSGEVQSLVIKLKVYKKDALTTVAGDGNSLSYNDHTKTRVTKIGRNYFDFNNATALVEKSFTYSIPEAERTSVTQSSNRSVYQSKHLQWRKTLQLSSEDYATCYNALWTDLETLDVSW
jgi:hypothetical protein